jgi:hypothetical protein
MPSKSKRKPASALPRFLSGRSVWPTLCEILAKQSAVDAAIAYVTISPPFLKRGARFVCDMSETVVRQGGTDPRVILDLITKKKVEVFSKPGLHAKVIVSDDLVVVGSANASSNSGLMAVKKATLFEAVAIIQDRSVVRSAQSFVESLSVSSAKVDPETAQRMLPLFAKDARPMEPSTKGKRATRAATDVWRLLFSEYGGSLSVSEQAAADKNVPTAEKNARRFDRAQRWADWAIWQEAIVSPAEASLIQIGHKVASFVETGQTFDLWPIATVAGKAVDAVTGSVVIQSVRPRKEKGVHVTRRQLGAWPAAEASITRGSTVRQLTNVQLEEVNELLKG